MLTSSVSAESFAPKAIIFDLLTALLDSWTAWGSATASGSEEEGHRWHKKYLELTYGCGAYRPYEELILESVRESGISDPDGAATRLREQTWDAIKPWPEVAQMLQRLREKGFKLGVVTNCSNDLGLRAVAGCEDVVSASASTDKLKETIPGLGVNGDRFQFDAVVTAEESGFYKTNREPYVNILHKLGVKPEEALFVAGSAADVPGAAGVGMQVVWHNRIGLARKGNTRPLREGETLEEALADFL